jgi:hypothetical protein
MYNLGPSQPLITDEYVGRKVRAGNVTYMNGSGRVPERTRDQNAFMIRVGHRTPPCGPRNDA